MLWDSRICKAAVLAAVLAASACAVAPPAGPSVTALPGPGKSLDRFNEDDTACRNYAADRTQNAPGEAAAASNNANASIAAGTLIGAAAGAALGSINGQAGTGAAIGAGTGLLAGASVAGDQAQGAADSLQAEYDRAYSQCMVGNGEAVQGPPEGYAGPAPVNSVLPAAIVGAGVAAVLLSTQKTEHDNAGGYTRPAHHAGSGGGGVPAGAADVVKTKKPKKSQSN